ncbi:MAG: hypothetical protein AB8B64_10730 [Granulosicoccus sp.]
MRTTIHFEGLPGSGKTTASERFCRLLKSNGIEASWWLEEASNHTIMPKEARCALSREHHYPQICLDSWLTFLKSSNSTVVLDGYAFQSTVRFLYANRIARTQIEDYFNRWQELAPETTLVYFSVENPSEHYDVISAERGDEWSRKLYSYVERSPIGVANGYQGRMGFIEFWSEYQQLCHELLDAAYVPVHLIGSRSWKDDDLKGLAAQLGLLPEWL